MIALKTLIRRLTLASAKIPATWLSESVICNLSFEGCTDVMVEMTIDKLAELTKLMVARLIMTSLLRDLIV